MAEIDGLEGLLEDFEKLNLTRSEKAEIVEAGAKVVKAALEVTTPIDNNREPSKRSKPHLKNEIVFQPNEFSDGSTNVGFSKAGYYNRFINEGHYTTYGRTFSKSKTGKRRMYRPKDFEYGTKRVKGQHFLEGAMIKSRDGVKSAMANKLDNVLKQKGAM